MSSHRGLVKAEEACGKDFMMLVLTRKSGEEIVIGGNIVVSLVKLGKGKVRIGIKAPPDVPIVRRELLGADQKSQEELKKQP